MSVFKQKNAIASTEFKGFEGIDATAPHKYVPAAKDMVNFRVLEDGSLQKRCGFAPIAKCAESIRAVWSGRLSGKQLCFIVYGNVLAVVDTKNDYLQSIGNLETGEGYARFIFFNSRLYVMDSKHFYHVTRNSIDVFEAYAPLYAKNWGIGVTGTVNESLNILTRHIRMNYYVNEEFIYLRVDHLISSIDAVYIDGVRINDKSRYYFDRELMSVCVLDLKVGQVVDLYLTIDESEINPAHLYTCKQTAVLGGYNDSRLFIWDGVDETVMYATSPINRESLDASKKVYGNTVPLYIPNGQPFSVNREGRKITAVCRHYDRLLIFTNEDTWMAENPIEDGSRLEAVTVNSSHGCTSKGAAIMCGNDPVCISAGSILKWTADTDELNESNAKNISSKIEPYLPESLFTNGKILLDESRSELLFYDPTNTRGELWIYNYKTSNWYKFDGIEAEEFFLCGKKLGFIKNDTVYLFDEFLGYDVIDGMGKRNIVATFESNPIDLGIAGNKKRLLGMTMNANLDGGAVTAEYVSDSKVIDRIRISSGSYNDASFVKRLKSSRFCYLTLRLIADDDHSERLYSTSVFAKL